MEIEVKQANGVYVNAQVKQVTPESLSITYKRASKPDETVDYEKCRVVRTKPISAAHEFKPDDIVEAYIKGASVGGMPGWQTSKIRDIKGDFAVVESVEDSRATDIVAIEDCREMGLTHELTFEKMKHHALEADGELVDYFEQDGAFKDLEDTVKNILVDFDRGTGMVNIWSYSEAAMRCAKALLNFFIASAHQKMLLLKRKEMLQKKGEVSSDLTAPVVEEFQVKSDLMGLAIGSQGGNIHRAQNLEGIKDISYFESPLDKDFFTIKIFAETPEAAEHARCMLDFTSKSIDIPREMVSRIIGKDGATVQEIVDKSGVVRVQIGEEGEVPQDGQTCESVNFMFTGTSESVQHADLLIQFHLKHLKEMQHLREEISQKMPPPFKSMSNTRMMAMTDSNSNHGEFARNSSNGFGTGGGRGYGRGNRGGFRVSGNHGERRGERGRGGYRGRRVPDNGRGNFSDNDSGLSN